MGKRRKLGRPVNAKGRSKESEQYAPLTYEMLNSVTWRSLSGAAAKVFLELRTRFHGANNGRLILSMEEAARLLNLGKATVQRALNELQEKGFIVCTRRGQWYGRLASTWSVCDRSVNGEAPTKAWRSWRPNPAVEKRRKTERGSGMEPSVHLTGPLQNRRLIHGSATEPVRPFRVVATGSGMGR